MIAGSAAPSAMKTDIDGQPGIRLQNKELGCRDAHLSALAERCEASVTPGRDLDCDVYEALGFVVRRKPPVLRTKRIPVGGIFLHGETWKAVGRITVDTSVVTEILTRLLPEADWHVSYLASRPVAFHAQVAGHLAAAPTAALALTAALLRANRDRRPSGRPTVRGAAVAAKARSASVQR